MRSQFDSTNGMYLVTGSGAAMLDASLDSTQFQPLLDSIISTHHKKVIASVATQYHEDRTGRLNSLKMCRFKKQKNGNLKQRSISYKA